jgi:type I restriction-modification system DNA methylase subunit
MTVPKIIFELVERFDRNLESYRSGQYNETQLRREFIDPFFKALGWDIDNEKGYAEAYKDVIHEDAIKVGGATKAPDYCFRVGGARKFFLEAKKPAVNLMEEISPAYQLRRYAWSAKLPLSILTDFEEFAVYDCRFPPQPNEKPSTARILYLTYPDYASRWEEITSVFSREAVLQGSFDKYAESSKTKKGTAEVDEAFLKEIESWREALARNLALRNPELTQRELNFAVQRTIDRIIFLRMCEDRGIEPYGQLQALLNGENTYARLRYLYGIADDRYNSGLFHFKSERGRAEAPDGLTLTLTIDDRVLKDIIRRLYYPESPYEFSVLGADTLGNVYEQFLGKVIRLTPGHRAVVEEKPEVKKAGGIYYTPAYIVDYIVKNTVGKLCEGKSPKQIAKLKILDPACGSGSFLIGAYACLLNHHRDWYVKDDPQKHTKEIYQGMGSQWFLTTQEKKRILLNNIYGVDIDSQAVEVTKLSLLLKVLEGENQDSLNRQLKMWRERALPDLGNNIKCGNSLIGPDYYEGRQTTMFGDEEVYRVNAFNWEAEFPEIMKGGGFDVVIGNPPYGAYFYEDDKAYLSSKYKYQGYQLDSYLLFLERAIRYFLSPNGFYGMIIPNPWLTNLLQRNIRRFVAENTRICEIVHFRFPVFPKVTVDTEVLIIQKTDPKNWQVLVTIVESLDAFQKLPPEPRIKRILHKQQKWRDLDGGVINIFMSPSEESLAHKCSRRSAPLSELCAINVGIKPYQVGKGTPPQTEETVAKRPYDSDRCLDKFYRPYLRGSDMGRYRITPLEPRYLKFGPWLAEPRPAADFDAPLKIVMRQTGDSLIAAIDTHRYLCLNNIHVLVPKEPPPAPSYILGVVNSCLMNWYYQTLNPELGEALAEVKKTNVAKLPIRSIDFSDRADRARHQRMVMMVERMLDMNKRLAAAKTPDDKTRIQRQIDATDRQIDQLVYELYGLTEEEIKVVEEATRK